MHKFIQTELFGGKNDLAHKWMRNLLTSKDINQMISKATGIDLVLLTKLFESSVLQMKLDQHMLDWAKKVNQSGTPIALVTDNMDIFNEITIKNHRLDLVFPVIINSSDFGLLKQDQQGKLFEIALSELGLKSSDYAQVLLIDDSVKGIQVFESKGGVGYLYNSFAEFDKWAATHLLGECRKGSLIMRRQDRHHRVE